MSGPDQQLLCDTTVNYIGDEVAAVAAIDEDTAAEAAALIRVAYEPLPALLTIEEAMAPNAPVLHEYFENNAADEKTVVYGDPDKAFAEADYIREDEFTSMPTHNCFAELHVVLADYSLPDKLSIWTPTQTAVLFQKSIAQIPGPFRERGQGLRPEHGRGFLGPDLGADPSPDRGASVPQGRPAGEDHGGRGRGVHHVPGRRQEQIPL